MLDLKNLFRGKSVTSDLPADIQQALSDWRAAPGSKMSEPHYHTRYVVVDVKTSGFNPAHDQLLGISAIALSQGGCILPDDVIALDFSDAQTASLTAAETSAGPRTIETTAGPGTIETTAGPGTIETTAGPGTIETTAGPGVNRQLMAFLQFTAKAPLVGYHWPFVSAFLQRAYKENLGLDFSPEAIDLAWLLPALFDDKAQNVQPLDHWLEAFGLVSDGRRDSMANALALARLMQRLLVRATAKEIDTAEKLLAESIAALALRRAL